MRQINTLLLAGLFLAGLLNGRLRAQPLTGADYLIFVHQNLNGAAVQQFVNHKTSKGYTVKVLPITDGMTLYGIKNDIRNHYFNSTHTPRYVLLVGDAIDDTTGLDTIVSAVSGNFIPTFHKLSYFDTRSDYDSWFAQVDSGIHRYKRVPQLLVGRLPARTQAEVQNYVDKLIAYETSGADAAWKGSVTLVAGDVERTPPWPETPSPGHVVQEVENLASNIILTPWTKDTLYYHTWPDPDGGARKDTIIKLINSGRLVINALATGANAANFAYFLGRPNFDAYTQLSNTGKYPVILGTSCSIGEFDHSLPGDSELFGPNILFAPQRGAVGCLSATGSSAQNSNFSYTDAFFTNLCTYRINELGRLNVKSIRDAIDSGSYGGPEDTYDLMTLLGDPGCRLSFNSNFLKPFEQTGFEVIDPFTFQNKEFSTSLWVSNKNCRIVASQDPRRGQAGDQRDLRISGSDNSTISDSYIFWELLADSIPLDSTRRFLTIRMVTDTTPENGRIGIDGIIQTGQKLSDLFSGDYIRNQYNNRIGPKYTPATGSFGKLFAYDLKNFYGTIIRKILIGYDDSLNSELGAFAATIRQIGMSPTWGSSPQVDPISMANPVCVNAHVPAKAKTYDGDIVLHGDSLTFIWTVTAGSITGNGDSVTYNAPASPVSGVQIKVTVKDKGGFVVEQTKTFNVTTCGGGGGGCPLLYTLNGSTWYEQDFVLTASEDISRTGLFVNDILALDPPPSLGGFEDERFLLRVLENEKETSYFDQIRLAAVEIQAESLSSYALTTDGRLVKILTVLKPSVCADDKGNDFTATVADEDGNSFVSFAGGELRLTFDLGLAAKPFLAKVADPTVLPPEGGGDAPSGPKEGGKVNAFFADTSKSNFVSIDVLSPLGTWIPMGKISPSRRRDNRLLPFPTIMENLSNNRLTMRLRWDNVYVADKINFYLFQPVDSTLVHEFPLRWAQHSKAGQVVDELAVADEKSSVINPGDTLTLGFGPTWPPLEWSKLAFYAFVRGFYTSPEVLIPNTLPQSTELLQNNPNPFNSNTIIKFKLARAEQVSLRVFNILGQKVVTLVDGVLPAGEQTAQWNGKDDQGRQLPSGLYFYQLKTETYSKTKKLIFLK